MPSAGCRRWMRFAAFHSAKRPGEFLSAMRMMPSSASIVVGALLTPVKAAVVRKDRLRCVHQSGEAAGRSGWSSAATSGEGIEPKRWVESAP